MHHFSIQTFHLSSRTFPFTLVISLANLCQIPYIIHLLLNHTLLSIKCHFPKLRLRNVTESSRFRIPCLLHSYKPILHINYSKFLHLCPWSWLCCTLLPDLTRTTQHTRSFNHPRVVAPLHETTVHGQGKVARAADRRLTAAD